MGRTARWLSAVILLSVVGMCALADTVAWYKFEDGKIGDTVYGNTQVNDSGPNALHGWTPYACNAKRVAGIAQGSTLAWDIDEIHDWFFVPDAPKLRIEGSMTLEAWVKIRGPQTGAVSNFIIFRGDGTPGWDAYVLGINPRTQELFFRIEGPGYKQGDPQPVVECPFAWLNMTVHVAGVFDVETGCMSLYVNGDIMGRVTTTVHPRVPMNPAMSPGVGVGGYHGGSNASFAIDGIIDDVRISDAPLPPEKLLCAGMPSLEWVGTKGLEDDGVQSDVARVGEPLLFAVRYVGPPEPPHIRLELRCANVGSRFFEMTRARGRDEGDANIYRARVAPGSARWEYRFVADIAKGAPTSWRPGPCLGDASAQ